MEYLLMGCIIVALVVIVAKVMPKPGQVGGADDLSIPYVAVEKNCPPHQWRWVDIKDQNGNKHGERLVCMLCGPMKGQTGREDEV